MRTLLITVLTSALAFTAAAADNPFVGTWEMNMAKSKRDPNAPKRDKRTIVYSAEGTGIKAVVTTDGKTQPPVMYDGREHPMASSDGLYTHGTGTATASNLEMVFKKDGKVAGVRKSSLSPDGRTMTVVMDTTTRDGAKVHSVEVYDKQ